MFQLGVMTPSHPMMYMETCEICSFDECLESGLCQLQNDRCVPIYLEPTGKCF